MNLTLVGTSRCDVPAREAAGGIIAPLSAARTAQRAVPTRFRVQSAKISWNSFHEPYAQLVGNERNDRKGFMGREQVRKEHGAFHEPSLRPRLADSFFEDEDDPVHGPNARSQNRGGYP
ncbi:MAG: hypothetical protein DME19_21380 [Verrucomicrobia bacterium]|nr:MAG: hypothetical protein DME19_21380 [Verrucomicrobiota bacterium]